MKLLRVVVTLALIWGSASCAAQRNAVIPQSDVRVTQSTPTALPGSTPTALPGSTPTALPGAQLGCDLTFEVDQANCSIAIDINIPPVSDANTPGDLLAGLHPQDLRSAYALPSQNRAGTVAVVDAYDDPAAESDLAVYRRAFGLPACTSIAGCFKKVNEYGIPASYPAPNPGWDEEISLDLDMISAVCPNCTILLVEVKSPSFDDLGAGVDRAAAMGATAIGNSVLRARVVR